MTADNPPGTANHIIDVTGEPTANLPAPIRRPGLSLPPYEPHQEPVAAAAGASRHKPRVPVASTVIAAVSVMVMAAATQLADVNEAFAILTIGVVAMCGLLLVVAQLITIRDDHARNDLNTFERQSRGNTVERGHGAQRRPSATLDGLVPGVAVNETIANGSEGSPSHTRHFNANAASDSDQASRSDQ